NTPTTKSTSTTNNNNNTTTTTTTNAATTITSTKPMAKDSNNKSNQWFDTQIQHLHDLQRVSRKQSITKDHSFFPVTLASKIERNSFGTNTSRPHVGSDS